jgi:putative transposase
MALSTNERERLKWCVQRNAPFGEETWVEATARKYDLESALRPRGRPKKVSIRAVTAYEVPERKR